MKSRKQPPPPPQDANGEVSALIETLFKTGQRLEELTAGQVDTVVDRDGRTLLLRGTQQQLKQSDDARRAAILNALPAHIALLDANGIIVSVNDAWQRFATSNAIQVSGIGIGLNYIEVCDRARGVGSPDAHLMADGIRSVLSGGKKSFTMEYPCDSPAEKRWFQLVVTPLREDRLTGAVVMHLDITNRMHAENARVSLVERLSLATSVAKVGVWDWDLATKTVTWDSTMFEIYDLPPMHQLPYDQWAERVHPEDLLKAETTLRNVIEQKQKASMEFRILTPKGAVKHISAVEGVILDSHQKVTRVIGVNMDITARKDAEETLFKEKERAQVTLKSIGDAVICTDLSGKVTFLNSAAEKMTGWSSPEAQGRPMDEVLKILDSGTREAIPDPTQLAVAQNLTVHLPQNFILLGRDGLETPIEEAVAPIHDRDAQVTGAVIVIRDVSQARALALELAHLAQHDFLTGLPNRLLLNDRINQAISLASRHSKKVAVLFLDLDGFKHVNDSLGHPIGDKLLQSIAKRLVDCVRASDTVSRQGGDEFVVFLSEIENPEDAAIAARRIIKAVSGSHSIDRHDLHISTSIGVSVFPEDGADAATLIRNADTAMYQAKENGRESYQFFRPAMNVRAVERQSIEESLRRALQRQEFLLHYQPKVNLITGKIVGAEALIRWTHPDRGPISPAQFIPVAEDSGLILPIGSWVLREACKQSVSWSKAGLPPASIAVNISAIQFRDENFLDGVLAILKETGLDPGSLEIELTESVLMKRSESTEFILKTLRDIGVRAAVDDFGTGYSSLSYLRKFPLDALKIDQSFVRQLTTAPDVATIVQAIISMGRSLNLRVVAEGVETLEELQFLQAHHCDEAQGYFFSRPVPPDQFASLLISGVPFPSLVA